MIRFEPIPAPPPPAPPGSPPAPPARSCRSVLVARMADDMLELAFSGQNVSAETLAGRGWSAPVVEACWPAARDLARRRSVRQVRPHQPDEVTP